MSERDLDLVRRAIAGSQDAYRDLVVRFQRPVYALILRMVRDPGLAEDLAQEVFIKAFRALESFDTRRKLSSWLFKIAHNATIDHLRRRRLAIVPLETDDDRLDPIDVAKAPETQTPEAALRRRDLAAAFEEVLARLRPEYREVLVLRFQEGLAYEEIAEVTGLPLGTVKTHLHRARKAMAKDLTARGWTP